MPSRKRQQKQAEASLAEIPDDEQWRLVEDSGILRKVDIPRATPLERLNDGEPLLDTTLMTIPFVFLYVMMDILIHQQYRESPTFYDLAGRLAGAAPFLVLLVHQTHMRKQQRWVQAVLFVLGATSGSRLVYIFNKSGYKVIMQQAPPLATVWVYTIVQLRLEFAVVSLGLVYGFLWFKKLKLIPAV